MYSVHEEENAPHTQGLARILSKTARRALTGWEAHGPTILKVTFQTKKRQIIMDVLRCYTPRNDSNDDVKEEFYSRMSTTIQDETLPP